MMITLMIWTTTMTMMIVWIIARTRVTKKRDNCKWLRAGTLSRCIFCTVRNMTPFPRQKGNQVLLWIKKLAKKLFSFVKIFVKSRTACHVWGQRLQRACHPRILDNTEYRHFGLMTCTNLIVRYVHVILHSSSYHEDMESLTY